MAVNIGAFLIEPILGNCCSIDCNALEYVLACTGRYARKHDVIMIVDEVKTGFRVARGAAFRNCSDSKLTCVHSQRRMGNGYPICCSWQGREEIMRKDRQRCDSHGGTYTCHSVSMAAAEKTLAILDETPALQTIADYGTKLREGMGKILQNRHIPHSFVGHPSMSGLFFSDTPPTNYRDWLNTDYTFYDTMAPELHDLGVLCEPDSREPWFICESHADGDILSHTLNAFEQAVDITTTRLKKPKSGSATA